MAFTKLPKEHRVSDRSSAYRGGGGVGWKINMINIFNGLALCFD